MKPPPCFLAWFFGASIAFASTLAAPSAGADPQPGEVDLSFDPGFSMPGTVLVIEPYGESQWLVAGTTGGEMYPRATFFRLNSDGSEDESFMEGLDGVDGAIWAIAVQDDGKIIIGGSFSTVHGESSEGIARLNPDGSLDQSFGGKGVGGASEPSVRALSIRGDGSIVIGGDFSTVHGEPRNSIARLNPDGSLDQEFAHEKEGANGLVNAIAIQDDGAIVVGGDFTEINGEARYRVARLTSDGNLDTSFAASLEGANDTVWTLALHDDGTILVGGGFTEMHGEEQLRLARLNLGGSIDSDFSANIDRTVRAIGIQSDDRIVIGGSMREVNGLNRAGIARLEANGTTDRTFQRNMVFFTHALSLDDDGGIVIGGNFSSVNGQPHPKVARLQENGALDTEFLFGPPGPNNTVFAMAPQDDGKVLLGGEFVSIQGHSRLRIARLHSDGTLDTDFGNEGSGVDGGFRPTVWAIAIQNDERILIAGSSGFQTVNGETRQGIARLHPDGALDDTFVPGVEAVGLRGSFSTIAVQPDNKILVGGSFSEVYGDAHHRIARLNPDGSLDESFGDGLAGPNDRVRSLALQEDGRIVIAGDFSSVNGVARDRIARLNPDGTLDETFKKVAIGGTVRAIAVQEDGKVLVGGAFGTVNDEPRSWLARLMPDGTIDDTFGNPEVSGPGRAFVSSIAVQENGKIVIGGGIDSVGGKTRHGIARLNPDGTLDRDFAKNFSGVNPISSAATPPVRLVALDSEEGILVGGRFWTVNGVLRGKVARLHGDPLPSAGFEAWAEALPEGKRDPADDPGGLDIPNLLRYAFGLDPLQPDREELPQIGRTTPSGDSQASQTLAEDEESSQHLTLAYTRRTDDSTLEYVVEVSGDLTEWSPFDGGEEITDDGSDETETVTLTDKEPIAHQPRRFLRLRITQ